MVDQDLLTIYTKKTLINITPEEAIKESKELTSPDTDLKEK